ncbi:hypothetical protein [Luethyella okanaganae]|uniref:DUF4232 domain-containing protein n=1 Tax=Luethyella okanaganae TaxID=69372 RepID=A0ABW1VG60_9MICO
MSTLKHPVGRQSSKVYWRRRLLVGLGLLAVIVVVVLIVVRPGSSSGAPEPGATGGVSTSTPSGTTPPDGSTIPTENTEVEGAACDPKKVRVEAITDQVDYDPGEQPKLSLTITNTGSKACVIDAGTSKQVFTVKSGDEVYWLSTDCQQNPVDAQVSLEPGKAISSSTPIGWDRTRSAPETCDATDRPVVPAGGASYYLAVSVDGIESADPKQFLLY